MVDDAQAHEPAHAHEPTTASLLAIIKALTRRFGNLEATSPLSTTLTLTASEIEHAANLPVTIRPQPATDVQPEPWLLVILEGN